MDIALSKNILIFNQGFIETVKKIGRPFVRYHNKYQKHIKSHINQDTLYISTNKSDTDFIVNINGMIACTIKVTNGYIGAKAVAIKKSKLHAKIGAIELKIKKEEIGQLYLKVDSGIIVDYNDMVTISPFGHTGFQAVYQGKLSDQKTEILVKTGAIVCTIY
jgi:hypothetical protein